MSPITLFLIIVVICWIGYTVETFAPYINFDLHDKPVANQEPFPIYQWWESGPHLEKYKTCDQYRCRTPQLNGFCAKPGFSLRDGQYVDATPEQLQIRNRRAEQTCGLYANSARYCATHHQDERCPNSWVPIC